MDLLAYTQIDVFEELATLNNINIPRLRGYRWMKLEKTIPTDGINDIIPLCTKAACNQWVSAYPRYSINPRWYISDWNTWALKEYYFKSLKQDDGYETFLINWDRIHGKRRKNLKYLIKQHRKAAQDSITLWNRFAGESDVLYIHARLGSQSWSTVRHSDLSSESWYIASCDDMYDKSYCDIYAHLECIPDDFEERLLRRNEEV